MLDPTQNGTLNKGTGTVSAKPTGDSVKVWMESCISGCYDKYATELYGILCHLTGGEAKLLVRGVKDSGQGQCGH